MDIWKTDLNRHETSDTICRSLVDRIWRCKQQTSKIFDLSACGKHLQKVASVESLLGSLTQEGKLADRQTRDERRTPPTDSETRLALVSTKQDVAKCK